MGSIRDNANILKAATNKKKTQLCVYCGGELDEGAHFCKYCGKAVTTSSDQKPEGINIDNSPAVLEEEPIESLSATQKLSKKLQNIKGSVLLEETEEPKRGRAKFIKSNQLKDKQSRMDTAKTENIVVMISHFVIPANADDILEFMDLASDNIKPKTSGDYDVISKAWLVKLIRVYQNAEISLKERDFERIENKMEKIEKALEHK